VNKKMFIFDLDGVLVEACDWHRDALNEALREICKYEISQEDHRSIFNGIPTSKKLEILSRRGVVPRHKHREINELKQEKTIKIINEKANERGEKIEMIKAIKKKGHIVCCYTNSIRRTAELMLEKTGIGGLFDHVLTNQDVKNSKPDPEGYLYLMGKYEISPERTYIIEDSPKGLKAAINSGAKVISVKDSHEVDLSLLGGYL